MAVNEETVSILPFSSFSDKYFNYLLENWPVPNLDEINDLYNLLPNPDKTDESDPDLMLVSLWSEYYSIKKLNINLFEKSGSNLFIFHCNTRSLSTNFNLLEEILDSMDSQPDTLGITETKLPVNNLDLKKIISFSALPLFFFCCVSIIWASGFYSVCKSARK